MPGFEEQRDAMIEQQLIPRGIHDVRVLDAMRTVPRELFVPEHLQSSAWRDGALSIGSGQTISQPYTVAMMCQALKLTGSEKVLEVGAGSGYAACVLSRIAREVHAIERVEELAIAARERVHQLGYGNVTIHTGDGSFGLPSAAPFDAVLVSAAARALPHALLDQLCDGGRIVIPVGETRSVQQMMSYTLMNGKLEEQPLGSFVFVPLIGDAGW